MQEQEDGSYVGEYEDDTVLVTHRTVIFLIFLVTRPIRSRTTGCEEVSQIYASVGKCNT
jgi:hypothetical protein